jgi:exodeoxyribonuclease-5
MTAVLDDLDWSPQQLDALDKVETWLGKLDQPTFYLSGFAGSGKSTLLRRIAATAGDDVLFAAFTGKAASVMRRKGCADATTIDRLIYHHPFRWRCEQNCGSPPCRNLCSSARQEWLGRQLNPASEVAAADLVIIDEVSMVAEPMARDLLSFEKPVLVVGDPGQLPPIDGAGFFTAREPDALLSEIHRQAEGSPIIHLATIARLGEPLSVGRFGDSEVILGFDGDLTAFDAVICGRNATRRRINRMIRAQLGFEGPLPCVGERLLILRNRHEKGLMNGEVVTVLDVGPLRRGFVRLVVAAEGGAPVQIDAAADLLERDESDARGVQGDPVTWGYAITCHKARAASGLRCSSPTKAFAFASIDGAGSTPP